MCEWFTVPRHVILQGPNSSYLSIKHLFYFLLSIYSTSPPLVQPISLFVYSPSQDFLPLLCHTVTVLGKICDVDVYIYPYIPNSIPITATLLPFHLPLTINCLSSWWPNHRIIVKSNLQYWIYSYTSSLASCRDRPEQGPECHNPKFVSAALHTCVSTFMLLIPVSSTHTMLVRQVSLDFLLGESV